MKRLVIDKRAIKSNLQAIKAKSGQALIYADLSGNAFGLGLLETAMLLRDEGINHFAVSDPKDAALLRKNGFTDEYIMMLLSTADSDELSELIDLGVICTIGSYEAAVALNGIVEKRKTVCEVQIKIDVGLGRYGFSPAEVDKVISIYKYMSNLAITGVFTTFSSSYKSKKVTQQELDRFEEVIDKLTEAGIEVGLTHCCDSAALFRCDLPPQDVVRIGSAFSGRVPGKPIHNLSKVGYIEAGIEEVNWYPKGHRIGTTILKKPAKIAVLSVGYYHGFGVNRLESDTSLLQILKNRRARKYARIGSQRAKVIAPIGMLHTIIDVTNITCAVGDSALLDVDPVNVKGLPRFYID